eukprot:7595288-Pyramimonas_sp.AAC.1
MPIADLSKLAEWGRSTGATLSAMGSQRLVAPNAVFNNLQEWIGAAGLQRDHVEFHGDGPARRSILQ